MTSAFPGTAAARRAYPPPVPVGFIDPGGTTPVEHALRTQYAVAQQYSDWRAAHSRDIDPDVLKGNAGAFSVGDAALALQPVLDAVKADADAARAKVDNIVNGQKVDSTDVAAQLAAQAYWHRKERVLDALKDPAKIADAARALISNADKAEIPVLVRELNDYLSSRNVPTGWLRDAFSARIPGLSDAQTEATLLARQRDVLAQNHAGLTRAFDKDTAPGPCC